MRNKWIEYQFAVMYFYPCRCEYERDIRRGSIYKKCLYHRTKEKLRWVFWFWPKYLTSSAFRKKYREDQIMVKSVASAIERQML